jgi:hypothetical protein
MKGRYWLQAILPVLDTLRGVANIVANQVPLSDKHMCTDSSKIVIMTIMTTILILTHVHAIPFLPSRIIGLEMISHD